MSTLYGEKAVLFGTTAKASSRKVRAMKGFSLYCIWDQTLQWSGFQYEVCCE